MARGKTQADIALNLFIERQLAVPAAATRWMSRSLHIVCVGSSRRALIAIPTKKRAVRPRVCERLHNSSPTIDYFIHAASDT